MTKLNNYKKQEAFVNNLIGQLKLFIDTNIIWKIEFDTYTPELDRYAYFPIDLSEKLFQLDSTTYLKNIDLLKREEHRVLYNLSSSLSFIRQFYQDKALIDFAKEMEAQYKKEFHLSKKGNIQLGAKYRSLKSQIEKLLDGDQTDAMTTCISKKEYRLKALLKTVEPTHPSAKFSFVSSHIHLNTNRTFISNQRLYEMICYDFLVRYCQSYSFRTRGESL